MYFPYVIINVGTKQLLLRCKTPRLWSRVLLQNLLNPKGNKPSTCHLIRFSRFKQLGTKQIKQTHRLTDIPLLQKINRSLTGSSNITVSVTIISKKILQKVILTSNKIWSLRKLTNKVSTTICISTKYNHSYPSQPNIEKSPPPPPPPNIQKNDMP